MMTYLTKYRKEEAAIKATGRAKPDMIAYSQVRDKYAPATTPRWGHVPGTEVGEKLTGRGEVAITGLHIRMMQGIDFNNESMADGGGAYAVVLAGGYKDDDDKGGGGRRDSLIRPTHSLTSLTRRPLPFRSTHSLS